MRKRIMDAWRVLTGEYMAIRKVAPLPIYTWTGSSTFTTAANSNVWVQPRAGSTDR